MGRVVIPKEMRRTMHLKEGEELEIFAGEDGLYLKKYSAISALGARAHEYARVVARLLGAAVYVVDTDGVLALGGSAKDIGTGVSTKVVEAVARRQSRELMDVSVQRGGEIYAHLVVWPILAHGDLFGALVVGKARPFDACDRAVIETACCLLAQQIGD